MINPFYLTSKEGYIAAIIVVTLSIGRAMAQVISRWPLTAETRVHPQVNPCGICGGQWHWDRFFSECSVFPSIYHYTVALQTHVIWGMRNMLT
jgi:hypothetical protein